MTYEQLVFEGRDTFEVTDVAKDGPYVFISVNNRLAYCKCPGCGIISHNIHSRYKRTLMDLPMLGNQTLIKLTARKFFCRNKACERKVFTERFEEHFQSYKRVTERVATRLLEIAHGSGGNGGKRLCQLLYIPVSSSTLIRTIHRHTVSGTTTPKVLGIDDWAYAKRVNYGTILVDMEQRRVIDLLPDRETETVEKWLKEHPGVEIVTRDRFSNFANAVKQGAPNAVSVADRWHLLYNLTEILKKLLTRNSHYLKETRQEEIAKELDAKLMTKEQQKKKRFEENSIYHKKFVEVKQMLSKGYTVRRICRELHLDRRTVYKWKKLDAVPRRKKGPQTVIIPYEQHIKQMMNENPYVTFQSMWESIKAMGYTGSFTTAYKQISRIKGIKHKYLPQQGSTFWQPGKISLLICKSPDKLTKSEKGMIECLCERSEVIKEAVCIAQEFRSMMDKKDAKPLSVWLDNTLASEVKELAGFARSITVDIDAVHNALTMHWSNGQVEGQVNRPKTIKRQMYGRASLALLRKRLVYQSAYA